MVGIIIGSGIFRTPASIAGFLNDPALILFLWGVGGVVCLFGALTYSELATMFPESGGVYVFVREGFGRCAAFVFGWTYLIITKPLAVAGIAVVMAEHALTLVGVPADAALRPMGTQGMALTAAPLLASLMIVLLTGVNVLGMRLGAGIAGVLTILKVLSLAAIVILGFGRLFADAAPPGPAAAGGMTGIDSTPFVQGSMLVAIGAVMAKIMWTYDGWSDVGAIAGEVRDPSRTLPRVFVAGTLLVTLLYVAVNAVYMKVLPLGEMRGMTTVAPAVLTRLVGSTGATAVTIAIIVATLGATHGAIITGARVTYAQACDGLLFRWLAGVHPRFRTPARTLIIQGILSCAAMLGLKTFESLTSGFIFTMWIFYGLAAASIFVLRIRLPNAARPVRCWGYPVVPGLFVLAAAAMTALTLRSIPIQQSLVWTGVLVLGVPAYAVWSRLARPRRPE